MANTLTGLYATIYQALDVVSREMVGFIPAVMRNADAERAAIGDTLAWPVVTPGSVGDITPAATGPDPSDMTAAPVTASIDNARSYPFYLTGEDTKALSNSGVLDEIVQKQFENAFRALGNEIEEDLFEAAYKASSRAYGTAGTTPFGTAGELDDIAQVRKILEDNGVQVSLKMVNNNVTYDYDCERSLLSVITLKDYSEPINYRKLSAIMSPAHHRRGLFKIMEASCDKINGGYGSPRPLKGMIELSDRRAIDKLEHKLFGKGK